MRYLIFVFALFASLSLSAQRQYTPTEIANIDATSSAAGGDLYHDTTNDILYIGLMTGKLVPINNTDDQVIDRFDITGDELFISIESDGEGPKSVSLTPYLDNTDEQDLSLGTQTGTQIPVNISGGNGVTIDVADNDNDSTNEIQDLNLSGNTLTVTNNGSATNIDLAPYLDNTDAQDLSLSGNTLSISNDPNTDVDLSGYLDNTDDQVVDEFQLSGNTLSLSLESDGVGPETVDLSGYLDNTDNQDLNLTGNTLSLTNDASTVDLSAYLDNTDAQDLSLSGNTLSISNDPNTDVDLSPYLDNTDSQDLGNTSSGTDRTITITGGNNTTFSVADNDNDSTNEIQDLNLSGNTLTVTNNGSATNIDLAPYLDNTDAQDLSLSGNTLSISNDPNTDVDLTPYLDNTDDQDLSLSGNTLSLTNDASTVDLSAYLDNTDAQDLSLSGNTLSISNDPNTDVDLSPYLDNTDSQDLGNTASGTDRTITITGGNNTTFSIADNDNDSSNELQTFSQSGDVVTLSNGGGTFTDNHLGTQDQSLTGNRTVTQGSFDLNFDANTLFIDGSANNVGIGTNGPTERLQVDGNIVAGDEGDGTVGLTINDGQGNANLTFNHVRGVPDGSGSSARIVAPVDGNTAYLGFELASNVTAGTSVNTIEYMRLQDDGQLRLNEYGDGDFLATNGTYQLATTAAGDIIETNTMISSKIFYPPAVVIDVSATGNNQTLDLHQEYVDRFGSPMARNGTAPAALPTYSESELYYYVTDYDTSVFDNVSISEAGVMTYDVISVPPGNCTFINVVFMVR